MGMHAKDARPTKAESEHMGRIKAMRCVCCELMGQQQQHPTDVHHIRQDRQERNHWLTLPLCWPCHQGSHGVHGDKAFLRVLKMTEWGLLAYVMSQLFRRAA